MKTTKQHHNNHSHHHHHHNHHHGGGSSINRGLISSSSSSASSLSSLTTKRSKRTHWGTRERTGMSFLIVIAFFAVFGLIILTELFMIDERAHTGMVTSRSGSSYGGHLGDSMPDYDNVKDDYDLLDENLLNDNKLGFVQFQDNKLKILDAASSDAGRYAGMLLNSMMSGGAATGGGTGLGIAGVGSNVPLIPWGRILPAKIEETLPHFPSGITPTDGSWQIVNGTRFKFFVFSAYYDRRDGARLVRVVGATKTRGPERVWCRFWYVNHNVTGPAGRQQKERHSSVTVMARVKAIRENWNLKYSACFLLCPVHTPEVGVPQYVSIVSRLRAPPGNLLILRNTDWDRDFAKTNRSGDVASGSEHFLSLPAHVAQSAAHSQTATALQGEDMSDRIAVCVKPFHFDYDQALYLMEYLEFYALMGVAHFTFYNHTLGPHATCVLQHYMSGDIPGNSSAWDVDVSTAGRSAMTAKVKDSFQSSSPTNTEAPVKRLKSPNYTKPTVTILPWNLRMRSQKEIRTEGLFAALNDCLYRNMYRYKYLALVDLDEFIVPRHNDTLNELLNSLNYRFPNRNVGAYSFQNAFFYLQFVDDILVSQTTNQGSAELARLRAALLTQRKTRRRFKLHPQKQRSKYICKPEAVVEAGNHFVWEFSPGRGSLNVPPTDAILQHYRVCEFGGNDCVKAPSVVDRTATKYVNRLVERVYTVYKYLKQRCNLPELPPISRPPTQKPEMKPLIRKSSVETVKREDGEGEKVASKRQQTSNESGTEKGTKEMPTTIRTTAKTEKEMSRSTKNTTRSTNSSTLTSTTKTGTRATQLPLGIKEKKRKVVVFFVDDNGNQGARLDYH